MPVHQRSTKGLIYEIIQGQGFEFSYTEATRQTNSYTPHLVSDKPILIGHEHSCQIPEHPVDIINVSHIHGERGITRR